MPFPVGALSERPSAVVDGRSESAPTEFIALADPPISATALEPRGVAGYSTDFNDSTMFTRASLRRIVKATMAANAMVMTNENT